MFAQVHVLIGTNQFITGIEFCTHTHYTEGSPSSKLLSLTQDLMNIRWNPVDTADFYVITLSSPAE